MLGKYWGLAQIGTDKSWPGLTKSRHALNPNQETDQIKINSDKDQRKQPSKLLQLDIL